MIMVHFLKLYCLLLKRTDRIAGNCRSFRFLLEVKKANKGLFGITLFSVAKHTNLQSCMIDLFQTNFLTNRNISLKKQT